MSCCIKVKTYRLQCMYILLVCLQFLEEENTPTFGGPKDLVKHRECIAWKLILCPLVFYVVSQSF